MTPPEPQTPTTEAGQCTLRSLDYHPDHCSANGPDGCDCSLTEAILAIEAEAAAAERRRVLELLLPLADHRFVDGMPCRVGTADGCTCGYHVALDELAEADR